MPLFGSGNSGRSSETSRFSGDGWIMRQLNGSYRQGVCGADLGKGAASRLAYAISDKSHAYYQISRQERPGSYFVRHGIMTSDKLMWLVRQQNEHNVRFQDKPRRADQIEMHSRNGQATLLSARKPSNTHNNK
jgi:hypothetical protein